MTSGWKAPARSGPVTRPVVELMPGEVNSFMLERGRVAVVEYYTDTSGRSRQLEPCLRKIAEESKGLVAVGRVNAGRYKEFAAAMQVRDVPDVTIYRDGSKADHFIGLPDEYEIEERIQKEVKKLPAPAKAAPFRKAVAEPMKKDWMPEGMRRR